jgi:hypothetical protein
MKKNLSLYPIKVIASDIQTINGSIFDIKLYSRFKYGDTIVGAQYGGDLARLFIKTYGSLFLESENQTDFVIVTAPYKHVPKGAAVIAKYFQTTINNHLDLLGKMPIPILPIFNDTLVEGDYGTLDKVSRFSQNDDIHLYSIPDLLKGKRVIFIDDLRITGSIEKKAEDFLKTQGVKELYCLYIGSLESDKSNVGPEIESVMNNAWVKNLDGIKEIILTGHFATNMRVIKFILSSKADSFLAFIRSMSSSFNFELYSDTLGSGVAHMPKYNNNFLLLVEELKSRNILSLDGDLMPDSSKWI